MQQPNAFLQILIRTAQTGIFEGWLTPTCLPAFQAGPRGLVGPIVRYPFQFSSSHDWPEREFAEFLAAKQAQAQAQADILLLLAGQLKRSFSEDLHPVPELFHTHSHP